MNTFVLKNEWSTTILVVYKNDNSIKNRTWCGHDVKHNRAPLWNLSYTSVRFLMMTFATHFFVIRKNYYLMYNVYKNFAENTPYWTNYQRSINYPVYQRWARTTTVRSRQRRWFLPGFRYRAELSGPFVTGPCSTGCWVGDLSLHADAQFKPASDHRPIRVEGAARNDRQVLRKRGASPENLVDIAVCWRRVVKYFLSRGLQSRLKKHDNK